jgi:hypothetical protein
MTESDFMLIEEFLDGELTTAQNDALRQRLAQEPALAKTLESARQQRELRRAALEFYRPTDVEAEVLARATLEHCYETELSPLGKIDRHYILLRWTRRIAAVAACLIIAMGGFWLGRNTQQNPINGYKVIVQTDAGQVEKTFATLDQAKTYADSYQASEPSTVETSSGGDENQNQLSMTGEF